ncbi:winged helix-turn-helix domain-containing protein [Shewanella sp. KX20019]|uniref:winged helix-turn-helix domain-containing protein n=1 Tax=Shewanella sp. KX20019 TaxID=2803864 RepID=UPI00192831BB|nr:winged helix-turn-helix domain-containing protein [Shewanella sp. KX20019]QQX79838.1 winged helix-turn-helix domain-containing protein [Shewanella sp. KX20019]
MKILIKNERTIEISGVEYQLSSAEMLILTSMFASKGRVFSRDELLYIGWEGRAISQNSLTVAIANLRKVIDVSNSGRFIITLPKQGYKIDGDVLVFPLKSEVKPSLSESGIYDNPIWGELIRLCSLPSNKIYFFSCFTILAFLSVSFLFDTKVKERLYHTPDYKVLIIITDGSSVDVLLEQFPDLYQLDNDGAGGLSLVDKYKLVVIFNTVQRVFIIDCIDDNKVESYISFDGQAVIKMLASGACHE